MKKIVLSALIISVSSTYAVAKDDFMNKIIKFYSIATNGVINFEAKKVKGGYELKLSPKTYTYKKIFNPNYSIKVEVDEGPVVTKPHFTFAKAGLVSKINLLKLLNQQTQNEINKNLKKAPILNYEAIVSFRDILKENFNLEPVVIEEDDAKFYLSEVKAKSNVDLTNFTGAIDIDINKVKVEPKKEKGLFLLEGVTLHNEISDKPVDNIALFGKSSVDVKKFALKVDGQKPLNLNFTFNVASEIQKVDDKFLNFALKTHTKTNDVDTIAFSKGIKESKSDLMLKNLGTQGVIEFIKFSQKMQEIQEKLLQDSNDPLKKEAAIAAYMAELTTLNNTLVDIFNKTFVSNRSRIILDVELISDKKSFIKLNLLYKAKPLSGDMNSALISLAAQGLSIFDGDFEIQLDKDLATTINPLSLMVLELLKNKGFATEQNGIYHLKGTLKDGKLIINGKAYTLQELTTTLF